MVIGSFLVVDVHNIDFLHLAPFHSPAVQVGNTVGRQVRHLYAYLVVASLQGVLAIKDIGHRPGAANKLSIDIDTGRLAHIAKVYQP